MNRIYDLLRFILFLLLMPAALLMLHGPSADAGEVDSKLKLKVEVSSKKVSKKTVTSDSIVQQPPAKKVLPSQGGASSASNSNGPKNKRLAKYPVKKPAQILVHDKTKPPKAKQGQNTGNGVPAASSVPAIAPRPLVQIKTHRWNLQPTFAARAPGQAGISGFDHSALDRVRDRTEGMRDKAAMDALSLLPGLDDAGIGLADPATGEKIGGRKHSAADPLTGQRLARGGNNQVFGSAIGGSRDGAPGSRGGGRGQGSGNDRKAMRSKRNGMISDDGDNDDGGGEEATTDSTKVYGEATYGEAKDGALDGNHASPGGNHKTTIVTGNDGTVYVKTETDNGYEIVAYKEGEKPRSGLYPPDGKPAPEDDTKPRPDDSGGAPRGQNTAEMPKIGGYLGLSGQPVPDDVDGDGARIYGNRKPLSKLDLAGQPSPDQDEQSRGEAPAGVMMTPLLMTGQPVDDDPDFGSVTVGANGVVTGGGVTGNSRVQINGENSPQFGSRVTGELRQGQLELPETD